MKQQPTRPQIGAITQVVAMIGFAFVLAHLPTQVAAGLAAFSALGAVAVSEEQVRVKANRIRETLSIMRLPVSTAATEYMNWNNRAFQRGLSGEGNLDDWRLEMLPAEFHRLYALLTLRDLGLPELANTAIKIATIAPAILETERSA